MGQKIYLIEWEDIQAYAGWQDISSYGTSRAISVGFLLRDDDKSLVLAGTLCQETGGEEANNAIVIPQGCVTKKTCLTK